MQKTPVHMSHSMRSLLAVLLGVFLFDFLFWGEKLGINCLLFSQFFVAVLAFLFPENRLSRPFLWTAAGTILTASMVTWHNSGAAKLAFFLSATTAAGFAQSAGLRFILHAFLQYLSNFMIVPRQMMQSVRGISSKRPGQKRPKKWRGWLSLSLVPLLVAGVFYVIYYLANDQFAALSDGFWRSVGRLISFDISFWHLCFLLFALFAVGAAFFRGIHPFIEKNKFVSDILIRQRTLFAPSRIARPWLTGLGREYRQSLLLLGMLNLLLLVVNLTDVVYVWFGFEPMSASNLKQYVHEGTYFLIGSILLAMFVLFRIFRKNLNFYPKNEVLKLLSLAWLVQNAILVLSVGIRNWRYIDNYALAYKRIGVVLFLILVAVGLVTLWLKIRDRRSLSWLWQRNSWAFYGLLLANSIVPWDTFITRFNLARPTQTGIDADFLISEVSDKNIKILEENKDLLAAKPMNAQLSEGDIERRLLIKRQRFEAEQSGLSWKSWNLADEANK